MRDRVALLIALTLSVAATVIAGVALLNTRTVTVTYHPSTPLSIRAVDVVADVVARHGDVLATVTVCNASPRTVTARESLTWIGGLTPATVYADTARAWPRGCTALPLRVPADVVPQSYRLVVAETVGGVVVSAASSAFMVSPGR